MVVDGHKECKSEETIFFTKNACHFISTITKSYGESSNVCTYIKCVIKMMAMKAKTFSLKAYKLDFCRVPFFFTLPALFFSLLHFTGKSDRLLTGKKSAYTHIFSNVMTWSSKVKSPYTGPDIHITTVLFWKLSKNEYTHLCKCI